MKKKKVLAIFLVSVLLVSSGGIGGAVYYKKQKNEKRIVSVVPVVNMMGYEYGNEMNIDGTVITGSKQNVMLEKEQVVEKVLVKKGDTVKVGTPLIAYDTTSLKLALQEKKNAVDAAEDDLRTAKKELERLQSLHPAEDRQYNWIEDTEEIEVVDLPEEAEFETQPAESPITTVISTAETTTSEEIPVETDETDSVEPTAPIMSTEPIEPTEPVLEENVLYTLEDAVQGDGSAAQPYLFLCERDTIVKMDLLLLLQQHGSYAVFQMTTDGYQWLVDGTTLPASLTDWTVSQGVTIGQDGTLSVDFRQVLYGTFQIAGNGSDDMLLPDDEGNEDFDFDEEWLDDGIWGEDSESDDYLYTAQELAAMIQKQQSKIKTLEFSKKSADLAYESALKKQDDGMERSLIDGVVTELHTDLTDKESETKPYLVIQGSGGLQVQGTVSEWNLPKLQIGTEMNVMSYDTGDSFTVKVTEIEDVPVTDSNAPYNENPNNSMYRFQAETEEQYDIAVGSWLSLSFMEETSSSYFYLPLQYVREENGQYYVMKANDQNRLVKQPVQTGKIRYGAEIEIKSGVEETDRICFPYGKDVKEGVRTKDTDEVQW
ncbi:MAG: hypothetical protein MRZ94_07015 [Oscillospiraceae bacterium]|nr:hypothetical protein [Oscillospiraceae bacterium]